MIEVKGSNALVPIIPDCISESRSPLLNSVRLKNRFQVWMCISSMSLNGFVSWSWLSAVFILS